MYCTLVIASLYLVNINLLSVCLHLSNRNDFHAMLKSLSMGAYKAGTHKIWVASLANREYLV